MQFAVQLAEPKLIPATFTSDAVAVGALLPDEWDEVVVRPTFDVDERDRAIAFAAPVWTFVKTGQWCAFVATFEQMRQAEYRAGQLAKVRQALRANVLPGAWQMQWSAKGVSDL